MTSWGSIPSRPVNAANRAPFDAAMCELVEELKPEVVSFHFGLPEPALLARVKAAGCLVMASATIVKEAVWLEANGADVIIAQGAEAGGHRGMFLTDNIAEQPGTFALVPQVVDAVKVPVIAAGGIADGRGIAAAFALGAAGVQIGTAYLRCPGIQGERPGAGRAGRRRADDSTVITNVMTGRPARGVANRVMREVGPISPDAPAFPHAATALGPLKAGRRKARAGSISPIFGPGRRSAGPRNAGRRADPGAAGRRGAGRSAIEAAPRLLRGSRCGGVEPRLRRKSRPLLYGRLNSAIRGPI